MESIQPCVSALYNARVVSYIHTCLHFLTDNSADFVFMHVFVPHIIVLILRFAFMFQKASESVQLCTVQFVDFGLKL